MRRRHCWLMTVNVDTKSKENTVTHPSHYHLVLKQGGVFALAWFGHMWTQQSHSDPDPEPEQIIVLLYNQCQKVCGQNGASAANVAPLLARWPWTFVLLSEFYCLYNHCLIGISCFNHASQSLTHSQLAGYIQSHSCTASITTNTLSLLLWYTHHLYRLFLKNGKSLGALKSHTSTFKFVESSIFNFL